MMLTGWMAFFMAWVFSALFYKTHPSSVDSGTSQKLFIYVFGRKRYICGYKGLCINKRSIQLLFSCYVCNKHIYKTKRRKKRQKRLD